MVDYEVVVARYEEDVEWLFPIAERCVVYNKGSSPICIATKAIREIHLPNLGREADTYLAYIIDNYTNLPDVVVFTQGRIDDHFQTTHGHQLLENLAYEAAATKTYSAAGMLHCGNKNDRDWGENWNKNFYGNHGLWYLGPNGYKPGQPYSFAEWFQKMFGFAPYLHGSHIIFSKAVFAVHRDLIVKTPLAFYKKLRADVAWHHTPIEAHFLERSWYYIFNSPYPLPLGLDDTTPKSLLILQTCDGEVYKEFLDIAEPYHRAYAARHGYTYQRHDGVIRGDQPWLATFNRIFLIEECLQNDDHDWVFFVDADAIIIDHDKTVDEFLNSSFAFVACRGATDDPCIHWDINIGVMFYNLRHPEMPAIIQIWKDMFLTALSQTSNNGSQHSFEALQTHLNDQTMLQNIISKYPPTIINVYRGENNSAFNYSGSFVRQILRNGDNTIKERTYYMKELLSGIQSSVAGMNL